METNSDYVLKYICGKPRLVSCGQKNANLCGDMLLNSTGAYIWSHITPGITREELIDQFCRDYECFDPIERQRATKVVDDFTACLAGQSLLFPKAKPCIRRKPVMEITPLQHDQITYVKIGDLDIAIHGDSKLVPTEFNNFRGDGKNVVQHIYLHSANADTHEDDYKRVCISFDVEIFEKDENYLFFFTYCPTIAQAQMSQLDNSVHIFCYDAEIDTLRYELFQIIGNIFNYCLQLHGYFTIHSASIIYRGKAWLFSASTGIGKTTHTNLWKDVPGIKYFNGDNNLVTKRSDGTYWCVGLPWCGTSDIASTGEYPLGGLIFVKRGETDYTADLSDEDKVVSLLHRMISPMWKENMVDMNLSFSTEVVQNIMVCDLFCTMGISAMEVMKDKIDSFLDK